ncbi:unnamed protein product [Owenia fusiformis]|uniref:Uncharacterized protein n=1 Tax=Owenia fusiformis TaxID=6347 RepID=A0A8J1XUJ3_OWEFU|nr:unnamed protein product [Owenia fusiformis]
MGNNYGLPTKQQKQCNTTPRETALMGAVLQNEVNQVKRLVKSSKADIDVVNSDGNTALDLALLTVMSSEASTVPIDIVKVLLRGGADKLSHQTLFKTIGVLIIKEQTSNELSVLSQVISEHTRSQTIRGLFLQCLVRGERPDLIEQLLAKGCNPLLFWEDQYNLLDQYDTMVGVSYFERERLVPPDVALLFIKAATNKNKSTVLQKVVSDMLKYDRGFFTEERMDQARELYSVIKKSSHELGPSEEEKLSWIK